MYKHFFSKFLDANKDKYHFACHSHHYWPDISLEAQNQYWLDSAKYVDNKWNYFFSEKIPKLNSLLKDVLNLKEQHITWAPNTHELIYRVISSLTSTKKKIKIITTDSEFYSFQRQVVRLQEEGICDVKFVNTQPFETFKERFHLESQKDEYDLAFFSNAFFNSGLVLENLSHFCEQTKAKYKIIDGYHSFMAIDLDLSFMKEDTFFTAGAYKYAAAGEGACFLVSPSNCTLRPINTGWFAELGELDHISHDKINYSRDGLRFAGATLDFTALYRFVSVLDFYKSENITVNKIHSYVSNLQDYFLEQIQNNQFHSWIINLDRNERGHFFALKCKSNQRCQEIVSKLLEKNILCDNRNEILRFGFSIYQDKNDIDYLVSALNAIEKEEKELQW